jgi:hypothetical protein
MPSCMFLLIFHNNPFIDRILTKILFFPILSLRCPPHHSEHEKNRKSSCAELQQLTAREHDLVREKKQSEDIIQYVCPPFSNLATDTITH